MHLYLWAPLALFVLGCHNESEETAPVDTYLGPPTATFPSFYGTPPTNLIVISIDTFRRDVMPIYGGEIEGLDFLSQLAEEGVTLDDHISCSNWTMQSVLCAQTGQNNLETGVVPDLSSNGREPIPEDTKTLASFLGDLGYYSVLSSGNGWFSSEWNMDAGFSWSEPASTGNAVKLYEYGTQPLLLARSLGEADKWYLHLHFVEPHAPYNPPEDYLGELEALEGIDVDLSVKSEQYEMNTGWEEMTSKEQALYNAHLKTRYAAEMAYIDDEIEEIFEGLREVGLLKDTLVVFWTDHGEAFFEHGKQTHAYSMHRTENDAIAFFWADNIVPDSFSGPTTHADIAPLALHSLGYDVPPWMTGKLTSEITNDRVRHAIAAGKSGIVQMVRSGDIKLIYDWSSADKQLYDLSVDPQETSNIYDPKSAQTAEMWDLLMPKVKEAQAILTSYTASSPGL